MDNRRQKITLEDGSTVWVSSTRLAVNQESGLPYPSDCYHDEPDENGLWQPDFSRVLEADKLTLRFIFSQALVSLGGKYSQSEINTFSQKSNAANAFKSGTATDLQKVYLAGLVGSTVDDAVSLTVEADRIIAKEVLLAGTTASVEHAYKSAKAKLILEADNTGVIQGLQEEYAALNA